MKVDILDWLLTLPFSLAFLGILLIFDPLQRLARLFGPRAHLRVVDLLNHCLVASLKLLGTRFEISIPHPLPAGTQCVIISNHQSLFDIPLISSVLAHLAPRFVAKKELGHYVPSISFNLRQDYNALIDRQNPRESIKVIRRFGKAIAGYGFSAVIFPEGTRARDGVLKEFHAAGFTSLLEELPQALVLPVTIDGSWQLASHKYRPIPRGQTMRMVVGAPINRANFSGPRELIAEARRQIEESLSTLRRES